MFATLALLALQADVLSLDGPGDDEVPRATAFTADGLELLVAHAGSGTVTRLDLVADRVETSRAVGGTLVGLELLPMGQRVVAVEGGLMQFARLHVLTSPGLSPLATVPLTVSAGDVIVDGAGGRALVSGVDGFGPTASVSVSVVDLSLGVEERVIDTPDLRGFALADDDRTVAVLAGSPASGYELRAIDVLTGATTATRPLGAGLLEPILAPGGDRATFVVASQPTAGLSTRFDRFDATTLAPLSTTTLVGVEDVEQIDLDGPGLRVTARTPTSVVSFDLTGASVGLSDPGVAVTNESCGDVVVSADRSRLLLVAAEESLIVDAGGAVLRRLDLRDVQSGTVAASPAGARFAVPRFGFSDRVVLVDAAGTSPPGIVLDLNAGLGDEVDGPILTSAIPGTDEVLVAACDSDAIVRVDVATGARLGRMNAARRPLAMVRRSDGRFVVGHADGTLLVVDPAGPTEVARLALGGAVVELHLGGTGTDVWARVEGASADELVHVETATGSLGVVGSAPLSGRGGGDELDGGTIAVDPASGRAAAVSGETGVVELFDIASLARLGAATSGPAGSRLRVALPAGADRVVCSTRATSPRVEAFALQQGALTSIWSVGVNGDPVAAPQNGALAVAAGGVVVVDLTATGAVFTAGGLHAIDAASGAVLDVLPAAFARSLAVARGDVAFVGRDVSNGATDRAVTARLDGGRFADVESTPLDGVRAVPPVLLDRERGRVLVSARRLASLSAAATNLAVLDLFDSRVDVACTPSTPNATGAVAEVAFTGSPFAGETTVASITGLEPNGMAGTLIVGDAAIAPRPLPFGVGELCVGGTVGRLVAPPQVADATGTQRYALDTSALSTSAGTFVVRPGDTWVFQLWHRDRAAGGGASANTSEAVRVTFR